MQNNLLLLSLFFAIISGGCKSGPEKQEETDSTTEVVAGELPVIADTLPQVTKDSLRTVEKKVYGLYTGTIPCRDCKEIRLTVLFSPRGYHLAEEYIEQEIDPLYEEEGMWMQDKKHINLIARDTRRRQFELADNSIVLVDTTGVTVRRYVLAKKVIGADNKAWNEKKRKGIDFIAVGNEPFWALDLDKDNKITVLIADNMRTIDFPFANPLNYGGVLLYAPTAGNNRLKLSIIPTFCGDGMSDRWYEYEVKMELNDTLYKGCGVALRPFY